MNTPRVSADRPWRLVGNTRKAVLVLHILAGVSWLGIDIVLGVFVLATKLADDPNVVAVSYQAIRVFAVWTLVPVGLISLVTGWLLAYGSRYGVLKHWWVVIKLTLNVVLTVLVPLALLPTVNDAADYGRQLAAGHATGSPPRGMYFPPIVSSLALITAVVLSIFKPWGRIRAAG